MNKELNVLRYINSDCNTTQRDIAKQTGMSLGNVNAAIKKLIQNGFLMKKVNERVVEYILTSEGNKKKSAALFEEYSKIVDSTLVLQQKIVDTIEECCLSKGVKPVLVGHEDAILNYLENILKSNNMNYEVRTTKNLSVIQDSEIIIIWQPDTESALKQAGLKYIHILDKVNESYIK